jgi:hypothetical protein
MGPRPGQRRDVVGSITRRRRQRLDLPPLTVRSTSSVPRPELAPPRRGCILRAVATLLSLRTHATALCYIPLNEGARECNRGYVVVTEPSSDTPVVMPPKAWASESQRASICASLSPTSPALVGFFCSNPVQRRSDGPRGTICGQASYSYAFKAVFMIQAPPPVRAGGGVPVPGRSTRYAIGCYDA